MGIQGLLPFLKKIHEPCNVGKFAGCTVAIDAYCWLHKGAFSCAEKLALGEKTDQYVYYCMKYINTLLNKNIKPIMVFDGCHLPSKKNVEKSRREKRELNKKKAAQFLREGKRAEARECLQRCIDITPQMALELMNVCRNKGVDCIVAPYEADAQLAYLNKIGIADVIITEDSDLLLFGCEKVLFKMDHAGNGILIEKERLNEVVNIQTEHYSFEKFRYMCILSGCDYLPSLSGIGLAKANKVFKIARQGDIAQLIKKLSTYLKTSISVPQEYIDGFLAANNTFLYQLVYDPLCRKLVPLNEYPADINTEELSYAGAQLPAKKALHIALGNINIYTGEMFADFNPNTFVPKYVKKKPDMLHLLSIWDPDYRTKPKCVLKEANVQERPNLKGKEVLVKKNLKKHSPHKRHREVEDSKDLRSENELNEMYASPVKKKPKLEEIDEDLHRFMFASKQEIRADVSEEDNNADDDDDDEDKVDPVPLPKRSPKFFNSLKHAHPEHITDQIGNDTDVDKENGRVIISPRRNVFACKSPSKKNRFNLNATKPSGTKSRFFGSSSSATKSSPKQVPIKILLVDEYKPVHSNTANVYTHTPEGLTQNRSQPSEPDTDLNLASCDTNENCDKSKSSSRLQCDVKSEDSEELDSVTITEVPPSHCFKFSKTNSVTNSSPMSSPAGPSAFNWSKFKFNRSKNIETSSEKSWSSSNKNLKRPFKKVVSESNIDTIFKRSEKGSNSKSSSFEINNKDRVSSPVSASSQQVTLSQCDSVQSFPYSIDSDCVKDFDFLASQSSIQSEATENNSQETNSSSSGDTCSNMIGEDSISQPGSQGVDYLTSNNDICQSSDVEIPSRLGLHKGVVIEESGNEMVESNVSTYQLSDQVVVINSDDESESSIYFKANSFQKSTLSGTSSTSSSDKSVISGKTKAGCRVSGLSKKSKRNVKNIPDEKQKSLKDMFSKFAAKPRGVSTLKSDSSIDGTTNSEVFTPEGRTSSLGKRTSAQKSLLQ